jgi:hypothetical protein
MRFPTLCCDTVTALCKLTAHGDLMPSSSFRTTSDGTPRIVEVAGASAYSPPTPPPIPNPEARRRLSNVANNPGGRALHWRAFEPAEMLPQSIPHQSGAVLLGAPRGLVGGV